MYIRKNIAITQRTSVSVYMYNFFMNFIAIQNPNQIYCLEYIFVWQIKPVLSNHRIYYRKHKKIKSVSSLPDNWQLMIHFELRSRSRTSDFVALACELLKYLDTPFGHIDWENPWSKHRIICKDSSLRRCGLSTRRNGESWYSIFVLVTNRLKKPKSKL